MLSLSYAGARCMQQAIFCTILASPLTLALLLGCTAGRLLCGSLMQGATSTVATATVVAVAAEPSTRKWLLEDHPLGGVLLTGSQSVLLTGSQSTPA